jgi:hypothetical protein
VYKRPVEIPYRRATTAPEDPERASSATIASFCSTLHRRRRSGARQNLRPRSRSRHKSARKSGLTDQKNDRLTRSTARRFTSERYGPAGSDTLGAARAAAVQQHHVGVLRADLVERLPDAGVIVALDATGEGDAGAGRCQHFGVSATALATAGGEKIAAVDDRGG